MATNYAEAVRATLRLLRQQLGHDLWMVTRIAGDELVVVDCLDFAYGLEPGRVLPYSATLDWRMVNRLAPRAAPSTAEFPAYATAGITSTMTVGSYLGVPLLRDGDVVGTLSGLHPAPLGEGVVAALPLVETLAALLSTVLALEASATEARRRAERAEVEAHIDPLTQLGNRLAWTKVLLDEESRCRRYGRSACVVTVDLDGLKRTNDALGHAAGDRLLRDAALVLRRTTRICDQVARVGGDEFAVLMVEASELEGRALLDRVVAAFAAVGVEASVGMAVREAGMTLDEAWKAADGAMYRHKRRRLQDRVAVALAAPEVAPRVVRTLELPDIAVSGN
jgi:diguanylate cyclase (GGDEF)-like protein